MKRHLKTHIRKKATGKGIKIHMSLDGYISNNFILVITKVEDPGDSGEMSDDSSEDRKEDIEATVTSLQFDSDPLDSSRTL